MLAIDQGMKWISHIMEIKGEDAKSHPLTAQYVLKTLGIGFRNNKVIIH